MATVWQILISVLVPGIILELIRRQLNQRGSRLAYYLGAVITHRITLGVPAQPAAGSAIVQQPNLVVLNSHTLTIRNNGDSPARNIDISHPIWPQHYELSPLVDHGILNGPNGVPRVLRIPFLGKKEAVTISYLYPDVQGAQWSDILEYVRSEDGPAERIPVILNRVYPAWVSYLILGFCFLGLIFLGFILWWLYPPSVCFLKWLAAYPR